MIYIQIILIKITFTFEIIKKGIYYNVNIIFFFFHLKKYFKLYGLIEYKYTSNTYKQNYYLINILSYMIE